LIESPNEGELVLPELPIGTFDLALYDEVQEIARLKNAITVDPPLSGPRVSLRLIGSFFGLDEKTAPTLTAGRKFPNDPSAVFEIIDAGPPRDDVRRLRPFVGSESAISVPVAGSRQIPAVLRVNCQPTAENQACAVGNTNVVAGSTLTLPGGFLFVVDEIRADVPAAPIVATVQFLGRATVIDLIAAGDVDTAARDGARVVAVRSRGTVSGQRTRQTVSGNIVETASAPEAFRTADVDVRVAANQTPDGLVYRMVPLKPGASFTFETANYVVHGTVIAVAGGPSKTR
jgi:hypothetical protein